jgi:hypothetical protein
MAERFVILFIALIFRSLDMSGQTQKKELRVAPGPPATFNAQVFRNTSPGGGLPSALAPDQAVRHFGLICRKEWALEKNTGIPFRFRLGSLEYTDRLEGKIKSPSVSHQ